MSEAINYIADPKLSLKAKGLLSVCLENLRAVSQILKSICTQETKT